MADLEQQLNAILGDPSAMDQIFALAKSLSGTQPGAQDETAPPPSSAPLPEPASAAAGQESPGIGALLQGLGAGGMPLLKDLDPQIIETALRLYSTYSANDDQRAALLAALRPFLKEERREQLGRAVQIARLSRLARIALAIWKEQGGSEHV